MKAFTKLFLIFFFSAFSNFTINAQGTITWALTTNGNATTTTGLTASPVSVGSGLTDPIFSNTDGVTSNSWERSRDNSELGMLDDEYYEYSVQTSSTQTFSVRGITFNHSYNGGSWNYAVYYSKNNFLERTLYSPSNSTTLPGTNQDITITSSVPVGVNITLTFRVYAWNTSGAAKQYNNKNFVITINSAAALPVNLSSFTAKQTTDNKVSLAWLTSSESVNKGFSIERQEDVNGKFHSLGFIPSKAEGGNSQTTLSYNFKDVTAKMGTNIYRLAQEDLDGKKTYSEVRVVKLNGQSVSMVFPNPSNGEVNISRTADGKKMNIQVIDQSGKIISQVNNISDSNHKLNIQKSGVYTIKMTHPETGEQSIQRIVVQK